MNTHPAAPVRPGPVRPPSGRRAAAHPRRPARAVGARAAAHRRARSGVDAAVGLGFTLALPLVALLAATAVLGPEIDDGSIVYLLAKPVSRHVIAVSKFAAAWGATMALGALPLFVAAAGARPVGAAAGGRPRRRRRGGRHGLHRAVPRRSRRSPGTPWSSGCSSCCSGRERSARCSPGCGGCRSAPGAARWPARSAPRSRMPRATGLAYAVVAAALVTAAAVWFTGDRLRSFTLRGDE